MRGRLVALYYNNRPNNTPELHVFLRDENDKYEFVIDSPIYPYCFVDLSEASQYKSILDGYSAKIEIQPNARIYQKNNATAAKISVEDPGVVRALRNIFQKKKINLYEADIPFKNRVMIDLDLGINIDVTDGKLSRSSGDIVPPKVLFFDEEVDDSKGFPEPGTMPILAFGCTDGKTGENISFCEDTEEETIRKFIWFIRDYDVLVEFTGFDKDTLIGRCKKLGIPFRRDQVEFVDFELIYKIRSMKEEESHTLDYLSEKYLKIKIPRFSSYSELFKKNKEVLKSIVASHANAVYLLEKQTGLVAQTIALCDKNGLLPADGTYAYRFTDMALMSQMVKLNPRIIVPCREPIEDEKRVSYKGALVLEPKTGLWKNVVKLDFQSTYPNLMLTANLSPEHYDPSLNNDDLLRHCANNSIGVLQKILLEGIKTRMEYKKLMKNLEKQGKKFTTEWDMAQRLDYFAKVLTNSQYGSFGEIKSRFYTKQYAEIITSLGRQLLEGTQTFINNTKKQEVIYGDSDSCFILMNESNIEKSIQTGKELQKQLNVFYPSLLTSIGIPIEKHKIQIEYVDLYTALLLVESKKRYAGIVYGQSEPEIVGFEKVRSDYCAAAKDTQEKMLMMILNGESHDNIVKYITGVKNSLLSGNLNSQLVMSKGLKRLPKQYDAVKKNHKPPFHVKAAIALEAMGKHVKTGKISYVFSSCFREDVMVTPIVNQSDIPKIDYSGLGYYWTRNVFPCLDRILEVIKVDEQKMKELRIVPQAQQLNKFW